MNLDLESVRAASGLTSREADMLCALLRVWHEKLSRNRIRTAYYEGKNRLKNLGIAIPEEFEGVETVVGWPAKAVDALQARSIFDGYVYNGDEVPELERMVADNGLMLAYEQATQSELINSCVFSTVGRGGEGEPDVVVNFHSAEAGAAIWDFRRKRVSWGLVIADIGSDERTGRPFVSEAHLHGPDSVTVIKSRDGSRWYARRADNPLGVPLMDAMPYRPSLKRPFGKSRISRAVMSITDRAVRTCLRAELGSEFYTSPQKYMLGASEDDLDKPRWEAYIGYLMMAGKDEDGDVPKFGQLPQATMQPHTDYMRDLAAQFSGEASIPMSCLGVVHDNPASADAIYAANEGLVIEAQALNRVNGAALARIARSALCVARGRALADLAEEERAVKAHFKNPAMPSMVSQADAMVKMVSVAPWVAETEFFLEEMGVDDATRRRLMSEKRKIEAKAMLMQQMAQPKELPPGGGEASDGDAS